MASSYTNKLRLVFDDLTFSEEKLAEYIEGHRSEIKSLTSQQLAELVGVGQSTVIRFSQKLGYGNFKKMLADITSDNPDEYIDLEIEESENTKTTNEKIREQYNKILDMTFSFNTDADIDEAVDYIYRAKRVLCCGFSARNIYFAQYLAYKLSSIGIDTYCSEQMSLIYSQLRQYQAGDVLIILSESGETRDLINFAKMAKKQGMKVLSITRVTSNTLQQLSDKNLKVVDYGSRTFLRSNMIRISILSILDMLFLNLVKRDFARFEKEAARLSFITKLDYRF